MVTVGQDHQIGLIIWVKKAQNFGPNSTTTTFSKVLITSMESGLIWMSPQYLAGLRALFQKIHYINLSKQKCITEIYTMHMVFWWPKLPTRALWSVKSRTDIKIGPSFWLDHPFSELKNTLQSGQVIIKAPKMRLNCQSVRFCLSVFPELHLQELIFQAFMGLQQTT